MGRLPARRQVSRDCARALGAAVRREQHPGGKGRLAVRGRRPGTRRWRSTLGGHSHRCSVVAGVMGR